MIDYNTVHSVVTHNDEVGVQAFVKDVVIQSIERDANWLQVHHTYPTEITYDFCKPRLFPVESYHVTHNDHDKSYTISVESDYRDTVATGESFAAVETQMLYTVTTSVSVTRGICELSTETLYTI